MNRRNFLTRSGLALGALIVGDEVLEAMDRLTHRKVYALGGVTRQKTIADIVEEMRQEFTATLYYGTSPAILYAHKSAIKHLTSGI